MENRVLTKGPFSFSLAALNISFSLMLFYPSEFPCKTPSFFKQQSFLSWVISYCTTIVSFSDISYKPHNHGCLYMQIKKSHNIDSCFLSFDSLGISMWLFKFRRSELLLSFPTSSQQLLDRSLPWTSFVYLAHHEVEHDSASSFLTRNMWQDMRRKTWTLTDWGKQSCLTIWTTHLGIATERVIKVYTF